MSQRTSPATLFLGSVVSGLSAAVLGPATIYTINAVTHLGGNLVGKDDGWRVAQLTGLLFGGIGIFVALFVGLPILLVLHRIRRLNLSSAAIVGSGIGLLVAMFFWIADDAEPIVLFVGCTVGAFCGWTALAVAYVVPVRPNKSLERTREG